MFCPLEVGSCHPRPRAQTLVLTLQPDRSHSLFYFVPRESDFQLDNRCRWYTFNCTLSSNLSGHLPWLTEPVNQARLLWLGLPPGPQAIKHVRAIILMAVKGARQIPSVSLMTVVPNFHKRYLIRELKVCSGGQNLATLESARLYFFCPLLVFAPLPCLYFFCQPSVFARSLAWQQNPPACLK